MAAPLSIETIRITLSQNPLIAMAIATAIIGGLVFFLYRQKSQPGNQGIDIDTPDYTSLDEKTHQEMSAYMRKDGWEIDQPLFHRSQQKGIATKMFEKKVPADDVISYKEKRNWNKDEDEEEADKTETFYFYKVESDSRIQKISDWFNNLVGRETGEHYRAVRKEWVDENGVGIHVDSDIDFTHYGGIMIEDTVAGRNAVNEIPLTKALEKHVNDKDEYAKKTDHMDREHSKQMGRFEKEIEADERRYGNKLSNR